MRVAPLPLPALRQSHEPELPISSPSAQWLGRRSSSLSSGDSDSDESSSSASYYSTLSRNSLSVRVSSDSTSDSKRSAKSLASQASAPQHGFVKRCLYSHPRVAFSLVLVLSAITTGAYSTYFFTTLALKISGAPTAFALVRTQLMATEITLRRTTECGLCRLMPRVALLKTQVEMETEPWKKAFDEYTKLRLAGRANLTICEERELTKYEALVDDDAKPTSEQLICLVNGIQQTLAQYEAAFEASPSKPTKKLTKRLNSVVYSATMHQTHEDSKITVSEMVANETDPAIAVLDQWLKELSEALNEELDAVKTTVILPVAKASTQDNQRDATPLADVKQRVMKALRRAIGRDPKKQRLVDDVDSAWDDTLQYAVEETQRGEQYHNDVLRIQNATREQIQQATGAVGLAISKLREVLVQQTRAAIEALASGWADSVVSTMEKNLEKIAQPLNLLTSSKLDASERISQPIDDWSSGRDSPVLYFDTLDRMAYDLSKLNETKPVTYSPDPWTYRASLLEVSSVVVTIVLTYDFLRRATWLLAKIASLMTESYSDLPPVDIRDIAPITTLVDFWGVLKCRYDCGSVVFTLLNEGSYVVQAAIHFVLWVLLEIGGTMAFVTWRRDFTQRCHLKPDQQPNEEPTLNFLWVLELLMGQLIKDGLSPLHSVQSRSTQLYAALEKDAENWKKQIDTMASTHTKQVDELVLERRFLLDLHSNLVSCSLPVDASTLESEQCSLSALSRSQDYATWLQTASIPFHSENIRSFLKPEPLLAACLHHNNDGDAAVATIGRLNLARGCQLDQNLYLSLASWWMLFVVGLALRFISRMVVKSAGMVFWRFLSGDKIDVMAYCDENGVVHTPEKLPKAVRRHLRNIRWRVTARMTGVVLSAVWVVVIGRIVLSPEMMLPLV